MTVTMDGQAGTPDGPARTTAGDDPRRERAARREAGRGRRAIVPRPLHASWRPAADRDDPLAILENQGRHRIPELLPIRYGRMHASPLAFLRGAAAIMAADLARTAASGLRAQSCGDCHLANFGAYATPENMPVFDINDFDETLPAPFEWDVKRLATSLVLAAREQGARESACRRAARRAVRAYASEIRRLAHLSPLEAWSARVDLVDAIDAIPDHEARARARAALQDRLRSASAQFGLVDDSGARPRFDEKPPLTMRLPEHGEAVRRAFAGYAATLPPERRILLDRYRLEDVLFKVVGIGSVGTFCAIGLFASDDGEPLLLQIKEAQRSVLEPFAGASRFTNAGERVVTGQRIIQAASDLFLGWTASGPDGAGAEDAGSGRQFYVRRLKDARLAALGSQIEASGVEPYGILCGRTLGRAHARSTDPATLAGYLGKGRAFAEAVAGFAAAYADQTEHDWRAFTQAIASGRFEAADPGAHAASG